MDNVLKKIRYISEGVVVYLLFFIFRIMPLDAASRCGGWLGRSIGPRLAASRKAYKNLQRAFPTYEDSDYRQIIKDMWENLGRVFAEYPHLETIARTRVDIVNIDLIEILKNDNKAAVLYGGHIANWEIAHATLFVQGLDVCGMYRAPNNPYTNKLLNRVRTLNGQVEMMPKSRTGMRQLVNAIKAGKHAGIAIDQKYNEGIAAPFFGHSAMTSPAFAQLAQKFKCPLVGVRVERLTGKNVGFRVTLHEDKEIQSHTAEQAIAVAHENLENWIKKRQRTGSGCIDAGLKKLFRNRNRNKNIIRIKLGDR